MAMAAFERARALSDADPFTLRGIGATASLASNRPKRGAHRVHVAWQSAETTVVSSCQFPGECTREEEEPWATQFILEAVAEACAIEWPAEKTGGSQERREQHAPREWSELLLGRRRFVSTAPNDTRVLFPGAFNPLHRAHQRMAEIAARRCGSDVAFELSIANVDKPPLDFIELADRIAQFQARRVLLTRAATFVEKAAIAPGCVFVVGADTLVRIGDPVYYDGDPANRDAAIGAIANAGCRFLVFGRTVDGEFKTLSNVDVPPALRAICEEVPEAEFREDISSTELRT
jgi:hypothetical protein